MPRRIFLRKSGVILFISLFLSLFLSARVFARLVNIGILHTNDTKGRIESFYYQSSKPIGGYAKRAILFGEKRKHTKLYWLTIDAGNIFGLTPHSYNLEGALDVKLMGWLGYDASGIGPYDFIFGIDKLKQRMAEASFPFLCANIIEKDTGKYLNEPFKIADFDGFRVGLIGVASREIVQFYPQDKLSGLEFRDPFTVLNELIPQLKSITDTIILVSGLQLSENISIASTHEEISVIVSGGQEAEFSVPIKVGNTLIVQAGKWGIKVGLLKLTFEGERDTGYKLRFFDETLIPLDGRWVENTKYLQEIANHRQSLEDKLNYVVGKLTNDMELKKVMSYETELGDLFTDAIRARVGADAAILSSLLFRQGLKKGPITLGDIYRAFPGEAFLATGNVSGANLETILSQSASLVGNPGFLQVSGVSFGIFGNKAYDITIGGEPLNKDAIYTIAFADSMLEGQSGLTSINMITDVKVDLSAPIRKVVEDFIVQKGEYGNKIEERITYYAEPPLSEAETVEIPQETVEEPTQEPQAKEAGSAQAAPKEGITQEETATERGVPTPEQTEPSESEEGEMGVTVEEEVDVGIAGEPSIPEETPSETEPSKAVEIPTVQAVLGENSVVIEDVEYYLKLKSDTVEGTPIYRFILRIKNQSDSYKIFNFPTGQFYDFIVYDGEKEVYRFSYNRYFVRKEHSFTLEPSEEKTFTAYWDGTTNSKNKLKRKLYRFVGVLKSSPERTVSFTGLC